LVDQIEVYIRKEEVPTRPVVIRPIADHPCSDIQAKTNKVMIESDRHILEIVDDVARMKELEVKVFDVSTFKGKLRAGLKGVHRTPAILIGNEQIEGDLSSETLRSRLESLMGKNTESETLLERVRAYEKAHNSHDLEFVMSMFTDDITFETVGEWIMTGKKKIRDLAEWEAALNNHLALMGLEVSGDNVAGKALEDDDLLRLAGFREIRYDFFSMDFRGNLIKRITVRTAERDREATSKTFRSMVEWGRRERYGEIAKLVSDGKFAYNAKNAKGWLALMQEWREATSARALLEV
jgi:hypothetical protein